MISMVLCIITNRLSSRTTLAPIFLMLRIKVLGLPPITTNFSATPMAHIHLFLLCIKVLGLPPVTTNFSAALMAQSHTIKALGPVTPTMRRSRIMTRWPRKMWTFKAFWTFTVHLATLGSRTTTRTTTRFRCR